MIREFLFLAAAGVMVGCATLAAKAATPVSGVGTNPGNALKTSDPKPAAGHQLIGLSAGCFWGVESEFREIPGVVATAVGYTGGKTKNPTYREVCGGGTGHVETVLVEFDPKKVKLEKLLATFWKWHNPTLVNRSGPDVGVQYRSAIWIYSPDQKAIAEASIAAQQKVEKKPIQTTVTNAAPFWAAEDYHQQYDAKTGHTCPAPRSFDGGF